MNTTTNISTTTTNTPPHVQFEIETIEQTFNFSDIGKPILFKQNSLK